MKLTQNTTLLSLLLCGFLCTGSGPVGMAQNPVPTRQISFQHLNTTNGLSYLGVNDMCIDKKGNLWISTGNGLNMFNGKTVEKYFASEYPQLVSNNIIHVTCDSSNRIWALTGGGNVCMIDEQRQFHRVGLYKENKFSRTAWLINSQHGNIILWTNLGHYIFNTRSAYAKNDSLTEKHFLPLPVRGFDEISYSGFRQVFHLDDDRYLFAREDSFYLLNYSTRSVEKKYPIPHCTLLTKWDDHLVLACDRNSMKIQIIDLASGEVSFPFETIKDQFGKPVSANFFFTEKIDPDQYLFTTLNKGIYIYNRRTGTMSNYLHSIVDPASIGNSTATTIAVSPTGWVFISCDPNGISYFNIRDIIGNQAVFRDARGNGYDGDIASIATKDNKIYFLGTATGLLEWNRNTNTSNFLDYTDRDGSSYFRDQVVNSIVIDAYDHIWVSTSTEGLIVLDKNKKLIRHIGPNRSDKDHLKMEYIYNLVIGPDQFIWVCGRNGICRVDPVSFAVDNFQHSLLSGFDNSFCSPLFFKGPDDLWFASTGRGMFHYQVSKDKLDSVTTKDGLFSNDIFCINADSTGNIYAGTKYGLNILSKDGRIKKINQKSGLLIDRAEGLLLDKKGRMWIGNDIGLACYNPTDSSLSTFDTHYGLSIYGFRVNAYYQSNNGEFVFGTPKGIQYFFPDDLFGKKIVLNALINKIETKDITSGITETASFDLSASDNQVTFYFGSVDYSQHVLTYYQYKLVDIDKDWINISYQNSVRYNALPPGTYTFKVRVSNDGKVWQEADNTVTITIAKKFWQQWWFRLLGGLAGILLILYVISYYRRKQSRQNEEIINRQKITESRLQNLRLQMNPHFLFNALNSIQQMILANEDLVATRYLSRFSKLLRTILVHSDKETITLKEEIEILNLYVELEAVRFKESFEYRISCDDDIETEEIRIPALLIQPFVENAIWHGLMHKETDRKLLVRFREKGNDLYCVVEDNGIGRKKAAELKLQSGPDKKHRSKGIDVSMERIKALKNSRGQAGSITIEDLYHADGQAAGTRVAIIIPL